MIIDDTLREGLQSPGVAFTQSEKMKLFELLSNAGIKRFIGGYPSAHRSEYDALSKMASAKRASIFGLGRTVNSDVDSIVETGANIALHIPTSISSLEDVTRVVKYASRYGREVEVSLVDISAYGADELVKIARMIADSGATTLQLPDTTGKMSPKGYFNSIAAVRKAVSCEISVHCHNDIGVAVLNSYMGYTAGATWIDTTILGLGERNGIADMASMVSTLHSSGVETKIDLEKLRVAYQYLTEILHSKPGSNLYEKRLPVFGEYLQYVVAGTHADDLKFSQKGALVNVYCGRRLIRNILSSMGVEINDSSLSKLVEKVKDTSVERGICLTPTEVLGLYSELEKYEPVVRRS